MTLKMSSTIAQPAFAGLRTPIVDSDFSEKPSQLALIKQICSKINKHHQCEIYVALRFNPGWSDIMKPNFDAIFPKSRAKFKYVENLIFGGNNDNLIFNMFNFFLLR